MKNDTIEVAKLAADFILKAHQLNNHQLHNLIDYLEESADLATQDLNVATVLKAMSKYASSILNSH